METQKKSINVSCTLCFSLQEETVIKFYEESELTKLKDALEGLRQTQAYLGLVDMLEWVLKMTADPRNAFEATQQFIEYLVVDNMYTENFLATSANQPGSPYRAMVGHEDLWGDLNNRNVFVD